MAILTSLLRMNAHHHTISSRFQATQQEGTAEAFDPLPGNDTATEASKATTSSSNLADSDEASEDLDTGLFCI